MAIWQLKVVLVRRASVEEKFGTVPATLPVVCLDNLAEWDPSALPGIEDELAKLFPEAESWLPRMRIWGDKRSNAAYLTDEECSPRRIEDIEFRIDVSRDWRGFVRSLCAIGLRCGALYVDRTSLSVIEPDFGAFELAINRSRAKKYMLDPIATLRNLPGGRAPVEVLRGDRTSDK